MFDQIHEECGVFGVYSPESTTSVVGDTYMALYALQHRGQQSVVLLSTMMVSSDLTVIWVLYRIPLISVC